MAIILWENPKIANSSVLGKDVRKLLVACQNVKLGILFPYEGCYRAERPTFVEICGKNTIPNGESAEMVYNFFLEEWAKENSEELKKEQMSRSEWDDEFDRQFRIIYGIAYRHGLFIEWRVDKEIPCYENQWDIFQKGKLIARIYC